MHAYAFFFYYLCVQNRYKKLQSVKVYIILHICPVQYLSAFSWIKRKYYLFLPISIQIPLSSLAHFHAQGVNDEAWGVQKICMGYEFCTHKKKISILEELMLFHCIFCIGRSPPLLPFLSLRIREKQDHTRSTQFFPGKYFSFYSFLRLFIWKYWQDILILLSVCCTIWKDWFFM